MRDAFQIEPTVIPREQVRTFFACEVCGTTGEFDRWNPHRGPDDPESASGSVMCQRCAGMWGAGPQLLGGTRGDKIVYRRLRAIFNRLQWEVMNGHRRFA